MKLQACGEGTRLTILADIVQMDVFVAERLERGDVRLRGDQVGLGDASHQEERADQERLPPRQFTARQNQVCQGEAATRGQEGEGRGEELVAGVEAALVGRGSTPSAETTAARFELHSAMLRMVIEATH